MPENTNKRGGKRAGAGRKSKAEEMELSALLNECWTPHDRADCIRALANKARTGDMDAVKLLFAYTFGKPTDKPAGAPEEEDAPSEVKITVAYEEKPKQATEE